jgi:general secretion pathway protein D
MPALALLLACLLAGCAEERIRNEADASISSGNFEQGLQALEIGVKEHPNSVALRSRLLTARSQALSQLIAQAEAARAAGKLDISEQLLRRASEFDSSGQRVRTLLADLAIERRQTQALEQAQALVAAKQPDAALKLVREALRDNRYQPELLALQRRLAVDQRQAQTRAAQKGLAETRPITLDFRDANLRTALDVLSRNSNINFVVDKDVRGDTKVTVYAKSVRFDDALSMILGSNQLARKVMDDRTVLIYPNTPEKQREYQEQMVKVFYLANGDPKGAAAFLKAMLKVREPYVDEHNNLLSLRDSLENIQLAERLITLFDNPEPEVLIDAQVFEVDTSRVTDIGVDFPTQVTISPLSTSSSTSSSSSLTLGDFPLSKSNFGITIPSATLNLKSTLGDVNTLANPQIRTRSREKAKILIGDKIPIITATTTGTSGSVAESVSYQDVGIKLDVEPTVYPDDDVAIRLSLEVSALGTETTTSSGTVAYQISTRNASTVLRLHDGEMQLLGGLISSDERTSASRLPGLGDLPILGRLFSDQSNSRTRTELVLAITPHIVRGQPHLDAAEAEAWVGTEAYQRLRPVGGRFDTDAPRAAGPVADVPVAKSSTAAPVAGAATGVAPAGLPAQAPVAPGAPAVASWSGPAEAHSGQVFDLQLQLKTGQGLGVLPLSIRYPSALIGLVGVSDSTDLPQATAAGEPIAHEEPGGVGVVDVQRVVPDAATGPIGLVHLQFKGLKPGDGEISVQLPDGSTKSVPVAVPAAFALKILP